MLIPTCFFVGVGGAVISAKFARLGLGGYLLAITVGLLVGFYSAWAMWIANAGMAAAGGYILRKVLRH